MYRSAKRSLKSSLAPSLFYGTLRNAGTRLAGTRETQRTCLPAWDKHSGDYLQGQNYFHEKAPEACPIQGFSAQGSGLSGASSSNLETLRSLGGYTRGLLSSIEPLAIRSFKRDYNVVISSGLMPRAGGSSIRNALLYMNNDLDRKTSQALSHARNWVANMPSNWQNYVEEAERMLATGARPNVPEAKPRSSRARGSTSSKSAPRRSKARRRSSRKAFKRR